MGKHIEDEVSKNIVEELNNHFKSKNLNYKAEFGIELPVQAFFKDHINTNIPDIRYFKTDILISEVNDGVYTPRLVIENKLKGVNTHDPTVYNKKAELHKSLYPFLRYGLLITNNASKTIINCGIPYHAYLDSNNFDFLISLGDNDKYNDCKSKEWNKFIDVINRNLNTSKELELLYNDNREQLLNGNKRKKADKRYFCIEKIIKIDETQN